MTYTVGDLRAVIGCTCQPVDALADDMPVVTSAYGFYNVIRRVEVREAHAYLDPKVEGPVFRTCLVIES